MPPRASTARCAAVTVEDAAEGTEDVEDVEDPEGHRMPRSSGVGQRLTDRPWHKTVTHTPGGTAYRPVAPAALHCHAS
jgi:hypothetical protein